MENASTADEHYVKLAYRELDKRTWKEKDSSFSNIFGVIKYCQTKYSGYDYVFRKQS
jgi:hypothetical protein